MTIEFPFNFDRAVGAMTYLVASLSRVDKVKLMKLLYIADRDHFLRFGRPITGSRQVAMDRGPVPAMCLDVLDGQWWADPDAVFKSVRLENYTVSLSDPAAAAVLDDDERLILDGVVRQFGGTPTADLVDQTHAFPEFAAAYVEGAAAPIPYELILRTHDDGTRFRHGRPVITAAMSAAMECPFVPNADADL